MAMDIRPASALRTEYNELAARSRTTGQPIYITRNGEGEMVFLSQELSERREAELTLLEKLLEAERNRLAGAPVYSLDEVEKELEGIYAES